MKIKIWNAFASNNSGSYTIVGSFSNKELASEIALELKDLMQAHTDWLEDSKSIAPSPLHTFVEQKNLTPDPEIGTSDNWPEYSRNISPQVMAIDYQVVIHHHYTVTLPALFGEYFYARGGRVETELNHAHNSVIGIFNIYQECQGHWKPGVSAKLAALLAELQSNGSPFSASNRAISWEAGKMENFDLTIAAVFDDLLEGFTVINKAVQAQDLTMNLQIMEAFTKDDPLGFFRPLMK